MEAWNTHARTEFDHEHVLLRFSTIEQLCDSGALYYERLDRNLPDHCLDEEPT